MNALGATLEDGDCVTIQPTIIAAGNTFVQRLHILSKRSGYLSK